MAAVEGVPPGLLVRRPRAGPRVAAAVVDKHMPVVLPGMEYIILCLSLTLSFFLIFSHSHLPGVNSAAKERVLQINLHIGDILRSAELGGGRQAAVITTLNSEGITERQCHVQIWSRHLYGVTLAAPLQRDEHLALGQPGVGVVVGLAPVIAPGVRAH